MQIAIGSCISRINAQRSKPTKLKLDKKSCDVSFQINREEIMEKNEYVRPMIAEVGDFSADTADNRPYWGVDWHITGRA